MRDLIVFAVATGCALLCMPVLIAPVCASMLLYAVRYRAFPARVAKQTVVCAACIAVLIGPYIVYQYGRLGRMAFIKSNNAFELYQGNSPGYDGVLIIDLFKNKHPAANTVEFRRYRDAGEAAYIKSKRELFHEEFDLKRFITLCWKRFLAFYYVFVPYGGPITRFNPGALFHCITYSLPGITLVLYGILKWKKPTWNELLVYTFILMYSVPYLLTGVMYRYSFPICTLTTILLARALYLIAGIRRQAQNRLNAERTDTVFSHKG